MIANLFAGPGAGKSTTAACIFTKLKMLGMNVELVTEYAKDMTWEERWGALACQPHIFGEQLFRLQRVAEKVDIVVTDSPILLSAVYNKTYPESFTKAVVDIFKEMDNPNIFLHRTKPYVKHGRTQSLEEAKLVDEEIRQLLLDNEIDYVQVAGDYKTTVKVALRHIFSKQGVDFSGS